MSLFGSIQLGANTLRAMQIGLQVVGNNIANANTPGFIREEVVYGPAPLQEVGGLKLGMGVQIDGIVQQLDKFVQQRMLGAGSDRAGAEVQENAYRDLEIQLSELSDIDLSTSFSNFFNSIDALTEPGEPTNTNLTVHLGETLTRDVKQLHSRVSDIRRALNDRVFDVADRINTLTEQVRLLNVQIATTEGGQGGGSKAGALRDRRQSALSELAEIVDIQVAEQASGGVAVSVGGEFLVFEGQRREVEVELNSDKGLAEGTILLSSSKSPLRATSGELQGLYAARDEIVGGFLDGLDNLAATLAFEFNKVYSQGQGQVGFKQLTSVNRSAEPTAALDAAGLDFTPVNGEFQVLVHNTNTNLTTTHEISVDLLGLESDTSLADIAIQLDAIVGIAASVTSSGQLTISADGPDTDFAFAEDTSGALAALGLNTFFTGSSALNLGVNQVLDDERLFAASLGGIDHDGHNAELLAPFLDTPLESANGNSIADLHAKLVSDVAQGSAITSSIADGFRVFEGTLESEHQAVSGVSLDEEAIRMIMLQRTFQAAARHIQTISEMLETLINI